MPSLPKSLLASNMKLKFKSGLKKPDFDKLIDDLCGAITYSVDEWRKQAFFSHIRITGPIASGGRLNGPKLGPFIVEKTAALKPPGPRLGKAVAKAFGEAWEKFQNSVKIPNLPWYPSFAAVPTPVAAPTPNVPMPLMALTKNLLPFSPNMLRGRLIESLDKPEPYSVEIFGALAESFQTTLTVWLSTQMIRNVLGRGSNPTFAPPYVPVGPVVGGDNIAAPGHLMA